MTKLDDRLNCKEKTRMGIKNTIYGLIPAKICQIECKLELVFQFKIRFSSNLFLVQFCLSFVLDHFP